MQFVNMCTECQKVVKNTGLRYLMGTQKISVMLYVAVAATAQLTGAENEPMSKS